MIRNERELQAALEWIEYWKSTRSGAQSWIGNEQAAKKIVELRDQIDAYRSQVKRENVPAETGNEDQSVSSTV